MIPAPTDSTEVTMFCSPARSAGSDPRLRRPAHGGAVTAAFAAAVLAGLGIATLSGCDSGDSASDAAETPAEVPRNVRVMTVRPTELETFLTISGPTRALQGTDLSAEEGGRVAALPREKGARVEKGQVLVLLDRSLLGAEKSSAEANRDLQAYNTERMRRLRQANSISELELRQAETQLREAEARADMAEIRYERAAIDAPFGGVVADRYVELGQLVSPGQPVARVVDPYTIVLESALSEREIGWIEEGQQATVTLDGAEGPFPGVVHWVGIEADPMTGKFPVEIYVDNPGGRLRPGVVGRARVLKAVYEDVVLIPRDAVVARPSGPVAFVAEGDRARLRRLDLGVDQGLLVLVEAGIRAGDQLIVRGQREVHDGSAIVIQETSTARDGTLPGDPEVIFQEHTVPGPRNQGS